MAGSLGHSLSFDGLADQDRHVSSRPYSISEASCAADRILRSQWSDCAEEIHTPRRCDIYAVFVWTAGGTDAAAPEKNSVDLINPIMSVQPSSFRFLCFASAMG